jgi:imidazolonepropionase-like amidohydrolase
MCRNAPTQTFIYRAAFSLALVVLLSSRVGMAGPVHPAVFIHGGTLIDGTGAPPRPNGGILIVDDRISAMGDAAHLPADATRVFADGKWLGPGLLDLHAHITFHLAGARDLEDDVVNAGRSERFLERYQQIGVTTVRGVGSRRHVGFALKRAQRSGLPVMQIIQSATLHAADAMGLEDESGSLVRANGRTWSY